MSSGEHTCCNLNIQRDVYSAFLAGSVRFAHRRQGLTVVENKAEGREKAKPLSRAWRLDTADVTKRGKFDTATPADRRSTEAVLQRAVSHLSKVANGRQLSSCFGMVNPLVDPTRDRATRLRSSDVLEKGIPDAKDRDVVAIQLRLF